MNDPEDFRRAAAGCIESRNRLVEQNMPLVGWVATRMFRKLRRPRADLISIGYETLIRIIPLFKSERASFSSFAQVALRRDMTDSIWTDRVISVRPNHGQYISPQTQVQRQAQTGDCNMRGIELALLEIPDWKDGTDQDAIDAAEEYHAELRIMRELLEQVEPRRRDILTMRYLQGLTSPEVARRVSNQFKGGRKPLDGRQHISGKRVNQLAQEGIRQLHAAACERGLTPDWSILQPRSQKFVRNL